MKRIVSLVLALSMVLSMFTFSFAGESLKDVEGTKYEAAVEALIELGVVDGYPDGTYLPENVVTRAELAKLLVIAYGLAPAAEATTSVTPFADGNNHWASGYINVSADYKFVNGYPDGSFQPDGTVTYAEAITMCLRVLGYANEIDSKGTWPTNYIAKAQDLELMKDIEFKSYNDGAQRGNVALLIWNMLRTPMWEVVGETEGDGLESKPQNEMLNVKFNDYFYDDDAKFEGFEVEADSKNDTAKVLVSINGTQYAYAENDFYKFVPGTEVEVLVNTEEKELLTMVPTDEDRLVEGTKEEMVDADYEALAGAKFDYAYGILKNRDVAANTTLVTESTLVDNVEISNKGKVTLTSNKLRTLDFTAAECDSELFLRDGERAEIEKIEKGEIITKVTVFYSGEEAEHFYVIGLVEEEGELTKYVIDNYDDEVEYHTITVDGEEYFLNPTDAMFVEDTTKSKVAPQNFAANYSEKMKGEDIVLKLDPVFGKVVRIEFDGKIDAGGETGNWKFFGVAGDVTTSYEIDLMDTAGEVEPYSFVNNTVARKWFNYDGRLEGSFVAVELNDEDAISSMRIIASNESGDPIFGDLSNIEYGDVSVNPNEYYGLTQVDNGIFDEDENLFDGELVTSSTVVARVVYDDNGTVKDSDDKWYVEFAESGLEELENVKAEGESAVVIKDADDALGVVKIVVLFSEKSDKSDAKAGIVKSLKANKLDKNKQDVTFEDGTTLTTEDGVTIAEDTTVVVYKVKTNADGDKFISVIYELSKAELNLATETSKLVIEANGMVAKFDGDAQATDFGAKSNVDKYEDDYVVVDVTTVLDKDTQYKATSAVTGTDYASLVFGIDDRVIINDVDGSEVFMVITGMGERTAAGNNGGNNDEENDDQENNAPAEEKVTVSLVKYLQSGDTFVESGEVPVEVTSGETLVLAEADVPEVEGYTFDADNLENELSIAYPSDLKFKAYYTKNAEDTND